MNQEVIEMITVFVRLVPSTVLISALAGCFNGQQAVPFGQTLTSDVRGARGFSNIGPPATERIVHSFSGSPSDGKGPMAGLIDVKGTLYGTTAFGGTNSQGTVYALTPSGVETPIYNFKGYPTDGAAPSGGVIDVGGIFYGTAACDGTYGYGGGGIVFSLTKAGQEKMLYSFPGSDCDGPYAGLTNVKGTLYGTTLGGAEHEYGCVFSITRSGRESVLYSFKDKPDGAGPMSDLIYVNGELYGTTSYGGHGGGIVFGVTTAGTEKVLHRFKGAPDGSAPVGGLIDVNGTFYGTTEAGGKYGYGTVFNIKKNGRESVVYSFMGPPYDGASPAAPLIDVDGVLYGTTEGGGSRGDGTVFNITTSGNESVLYSFGGSPNDGAKPQAPLLDFKGTLYGTTYSGGAYGGSYGYGTLFSISLSR
jgi:uncharacterized repeat protein (TIGR03803 family)